VGPGSGDGRFGVVSGFGFEGSDHRRMLFSCRCQEEDGWRICFGTKCFGGLGVTAASCTLSLDYSVRYCQI
jgi:hypothetical protein